MRIRFLYTLIFICSIELRLVAQTDTLFWFAAPEVTIGSNSYDRPIVLRIAAHSEDATVSVSQPANSSFPEQTITINAGGMQSVDLTTWIDVIENKPANAVLPYGIKITSTSPITVYYEVVSDQCNCNPEIFVLKGRNALGSDFWIPSQNTFNNNPVYSPITNSSFDIVATEDNTTITITPSNAIIGHDADLAYMIQLNEGETYSATATSGLAQDHLNGSRVLSDRPIAITIKDDVMKNTFYGTCSDLGGDQLIPTTLLGTEYVAMNGFLSQPDQVFVLATQNGTILFQDGVQISNLDAGATLQLNVGNVSTYITWKFPRS